MATEKAIDVFRRRVRFVMQEKGVTITELANSIGTSRSSMSKILSGQEHVSVERAERIANSLEIPLSELFSENFVARH